MSISHEMSFSPLFETAMLLFHMYVPAHSEDPCDGRRCQRDCVVVNNVAWCICLENEFLNEDSTTCTPVIPCEETVKANLNCMDFCHLISADNPVCRCNSENFREKYLRNTNCKNTDLCVLQKCKEMCVHEGDKVKCACKTGRTFDERGRCRDMNPCERKNMGCEDPVCIRDENDNWSCGCHKGRVLGDDGHSCYPACHPQVSKCSDECHEVNYKATCMCNGNRILMEDKATCRERNQCEEGVCGLGATCKMVQGQARCTCESPFVTSFQNPSDCVHTCIAFNCDFACREVKGNSNPCICPSGATLMYLGACRPKTPCELLSCHNASGASCSEDEPARCECLKDGYHLSADGKRCEENKSCQELQCDILTSATCDQRGGVYKCFCPPGYTLEEDGKRCRVKTACDLKKCEHGCQFFGGIARCTCNEFYAPDPKDNTKCKLHCEVMECEGKCQNLADGAICLCPPGKVISNDKRTCRERNLCDQKLCSDICEMENGEPHCMCSEGKKLVGNDCKYPCYFKGCSKLCRNVHGRAECYCPEGQILENNKRSCVIEGEWSMWFPKGECSTTCGEGTMPIFRNCSRKGGNLHMPYLCQGTSTYNFVTCRGSKKCSESDSGALMPWTTTSCLILLVVFAVIYFRKCNDVGQFSDHTFTTSYSLDSVIDSLGSTSGVDSSPRQVDSWPLIEDTSEKDVDSVPVVEDTAPKRPVIRPLSLLPTLPWVDKKDSTLHHTDKSPKEDDYTMHATETPPPPAKETEIKDSPVSPASEAIPGAGSPLAEETNAHENEHPLGVGDISAQRHKDSVDGLHLTASSLLEHFSDKDLV